MGIVTGEGKFSICNFFVRELGVLVCFLFFYFTLHRCSTPLEDKRVSASSYMCFLSKYAFTWQGMDGMKVMRVCVCIWWGNADDCTYFTRVRMDVVIFIHQDRRISIGTKFEGMGNWGD